MQVTDPTTLFLCGVDICCYLQISGNRSRIKKLFQKKQKGLSHRKTQVQYSEQTYNYIILKNGDKCFFDKIDSKKVSELCWRYSPKYSVFASTRGCRDNRKTVIMSRWILEYSGDKYIDHIDGNNLNNRRCNLRLASPEENTRNRRVYKNKNGYKGVRKMESGRYRAQIKSGGKIYYSKRFDTPRDAAIAYNHLAEIHHKDFMSPNKIS